VRTHLPRRRVTTMATAVAAVATVVLAGCGSSSSSSSKAAGSSSKAVNVSITSFIGSFASLSEYVAQQKGFFAKDGINAKFVDVDSGSDAMQAMLSGSANMANVAIFESLEAAAQGESVKYIVGAATATFGELVVSSKVKLPDAAAGYPAVLKDLKGMKIGVSSKASATYYTLALALKGAGLNPNKDVTVLAAGTLAQQLTAMQAGQIQAFMSQEPTTTQAVSSGAGRVVFYAYKGNRPAIFDNLITNGIAATGAYIKANPAAVKGVHDAIAEADNYISGLSSAQITTLASQIGTDFPGVPKSVLAQAIMHYQKLYTPVMSKAGVTAANQVLQQFGVIKSTVPYAEVVGPTAAQHS
jgi:NitT/TauT family transport system substrate-binding protein